MNPMNPYILQKCIEELSQKKPNKAYVKGMLETMLALTCEDLFNTNANFRFNVAEKEKIAQKNNKVEHKPIELTDEENESNLQATRYANGPIGKIS